MRVLGGATVLWETTGSWLFGISPRQQRREAPCLVGPAAPGRTNRRFPGCVLAHPLGIAVCHGEAAVPVVACWACRGHAGLDVVHLMNAFGRHDFFHRT